MEKVDLEEFCTFKAIKPWCIYLAIWFLFVAFIKRFKPEAIPFDLFEPFYKMDVFGAIAAGIPFYIWGLVCTAFFYSIRSKSNAEIIEFPLKWQKASRLLFCISAKAGILEELMFRWVYFYAVIVIVKISAFLIFGFIDPKYEVVRVCHLYIFGPITNFVSFNTLGWLLFDKGWAVGAAVLSTTASFRDGHRYNGILGMINAWFFSLFMFFIMFRYGIMGAVAMHFTYDFLVLIFAFALYRGGNSEKLSTVVIEMNPKRKEEE